VAAPTVSDPEAIAFDGIHLWITNTDGNSVTEINASIGGDVLASGGDDLLAGGGLAGCVLVPAAEG
jgi:hypothetical protein